MFWLKTLMNMQQIPMRLSVRENTCSGNVTETGNISALPDLFPRWQHQHTV